MVFTVEQNVHSAIADKLSPPSYYVSFLYSFISKSMAVDLGDG
jgi:hypothetical protein